MRYALDQGVRQFIDLGCGVSTVGSLHTIAHGVDPAAPVVYVDIDPVAVAHACRMWRANPAVGVVQADIRDIMAILDHPRTRGLVDFARPVCVLLVGVLHFVPGDLTGVTVAVRARLSRNSLLVISHGIEPAPAYAAQSEKVRRIYADAGAPLCYRTPDEIAALFAGWRLVSPHNGAVSRARPSLVPVRRWRLDSDTAAAQDDPHGRLCGLLSGVARRTSEQADPAYQPFASGRAAAEAEAMAIRGDASDARTGDRGDPASLAEIVRTTR